MFSPRLQHSAVRFTDRPFPFLSLVLFPPARNFMNCTYIQPANVPRNNTCSYLIMREGMVAQVQYGAVPLQLQSTCCSDHPSSINRSRKRVLASARFPVLSARSPAPSKAIGPPRRLAAPSQDDRSIESSRFERWIRFIGIGNPKRIVRITRPGRAD